MENSTWRTSVIEYDPSHCEPPNHAHWRDSRPGPALQSSAEFQYRDKVAPLDPCEVYRIRGVSDHWHDNRWTRVRFPPPPPAIWF